MRKLIIAFLVCVALTFAVNRYAGLTQTAQRFDDFHWSYLPIVLAAVLLYYVMKGIRWHFLLRTVNIVLPLRISLLVYLSGQWFAFSPMGEFVKAYLLGRYGVDFRQASSTIVVQVLIDFISLAVLGSLTLFWYPTLAYLVLPFTALLFLGLGLLHQNGLWRALDRWQQRFSLLRRLGFSWQNALLDTQCLTAGNTLFVGLAMGIPTILVGSATLLLIAVGFSAPLDMIQSTFIYSISQLLGALSMLPHGLGVVEGSAVALFDQLEFEDHSSTAAIIAFFRLSTLVWGVGVGGLAFLAMPFVRAREARQALKTEVPQLEAES